MSMGALVSSALNVVEMPDHLCVSTGKLARIATIISNEQTHSQDVGVGLRGCAWLVVRKPG